jgi:hypothetical protein
MMAMTVEMTMGMMGGGGVWRGNATIRWTRGVRGEQREVMADGAMSSGGARQMGGGGVS